MDLEQVVFKFFLSNTMLRSKPLANTYTILFHMHYLV